MAESKSSIGNVIDNKTLTGMAMGYARSRALGAAARLGVADALGNTPQSVDHLATTCHADPSSLYRLLRALASFGVVAETQPGTFILTALGEPLRKDSPNSEWAAIVFWSDLLADSWAQLTECIRTGDNAMAVMQREGITPLWSRDPTASNIFRAVMGTAPAGDYMGIAKAWNFATHHVVADLGGGGGALIAAVLEAYPNLTGILVDLPESIERAKPRFAQGDLARRCKLISADLCAAVPAGADVYVMKHFLHGHQDDEAIALLRNCSSVLPPEGRLLIIEFVLPDVVDHADENLEPRFMSDLNMLAVTGGKERSGVEWKALLKASGFECLNILPVRGELVSIIEAAPQA